MPPAVRHNALTAFGETSSVRLALTLPSGCLCLQHPFYMLRKITFEMYTHVMDGKESVLKCQLFKNFAVGISFRVLFPDQSQKYLLSEEARLQEAQAGY